MPSAPTAATRKLYRATTARSPCSPIWRGHTAAAAPRSWPWVNPKPLRRVSAKRCGWHPATIRRSTPWAWHSSVSVALTKRGSASAERSRSIRPMSPQQFDVHFQRGVALALLERHHESLASFSTAVILNPDSAEAVGNRGAVLVRLFRPAEALPDFARAVVLKPDYADAFLNAGIARRGLGRYREALDDLDRALSIRPEDPTAAWMKALLHLALGEFREGWPLYESRAQLPHARQLQRTLPGTRWTGTEPLAGRTLLVYADQGLGDTLQFC